MFSKVLIANRGEIACRIIRTLDSMGIASVAVYSEADKESLHVEMATQAVELEGFLPAQTYLNGEKIIATALSTGAQAIHPGYGFLSENPDFARSCVRANLVFIGPTALNMETFGLKHRARETAIAAGVALLPGTGLLGSVNEALAAAQKIGFPVILKSTGGGGGIGMQICRDSKALDQAFTQVQALAQRNFKDGGVYLEKYVDRARHIEVQVFGDGLGGVAILGDRDCSAQRRNQKVLEECPAPGLSIQARQSLHDQAQKLTAYAQYTNAGTVEFVFDTATEQSYFLEVNTRLQVEHTVTEEVLGIDLVNWMVRQAAGLWTLDEAKNLKATGHCIQARLYAEDPLKAFQPCSGLITQTLWPQNSRVETWVRPGVIMTTYYDPLLAKIIKKAPTRAQALAELAQALETTRVSGIQTNRSYLVSILNSEVFQTAQTTTGFLGTFFPPETAFEVLSAGTQTTVQDWPGRGGLWQVGIPPSGPMDDLSFRLGNRLLGNQSGAAGLEITLTGPKIKFRSSTWVCLTGANFTGDLDGKALEWNTPFKVEQDQVLTLGKVQSPGQRGYLLFSGGLDVPTYLGSASTFTLGAFGGHGGRALKTGDVVSYWPGLSPTIKEFNSKIFHPGWDSKNIRVIYGPQGAPEYFKESDIQKFLQVPWEVHFNSSRTGVRLMGPTPDWPRPDGGEAGLHPSNLHDNPYAVGALDFTGDMPILLGPDGPSLGGFVCPFTVITADLWKLGQLAPGDQVRFTAVSLEQARTAATEQETIIQTLEFPNPAPEKASVLENPILRQWKTREGLDICVRRGSDRRALVEIGQMELDLKLRLVVQWWLTELEKANLPGVLDLTPGIRSLQIHIDDQKTTWESLLYILETMTQELPPMDQVKVPSRTVWLPLSWDDPSTRLAIQKYMTNVRPNAPWCPWNIEFIRRINGLKTWEEVQEIVFNAQYLVLGLGDVYLGAPVATPLDPRHRLVTTKYNPARTWTPENAVGIGGAYLCVYGMEGPGGYQFVGRTVQMWNRFFTTPDFTKPWLLRFFDRIRFYPVSTEELAVLRRDFPMGRTNLKIEDGEFSWAEYAQFLQKEDASILAFGQRQKIAFEEEKRQWKYTGQDSFQAQTPVPEVQSITLKPGMTPLESTVSGVLWQVKTQEGQVVKKGDVLAIVESMKMEISMEATMDGLVDQVFLGTGEQVTQGQVILSLKEI